MLSFHWKVRYWGSEGEEWTLVNAASHLAALDASGIDRSKIISVRRQWLNISHLRLRWLRLSEQQQLGVLLNVQAQCLTGNFSNLKDTIYRTKALVKIAEMVPAAARNDLEVGKRLRYLRFNPEICAIVENGERVGNLTSGVGEAIQYLQHLGELRTKTSRQFVLGLLMFAASLGIVFLFLPTLPQAIRPLVEIDGVEFRKTIATETLLFVSEFIDANRVWLLGILLAAAAAGLLCYPKIRRWWPLSLFDDLVKNKRAIKFLSTWALYRASGMVLETDKTSLYRVLGNEVGASVYRAVKRGEALHDSVTAKHFSLVLVDALPALCRFNNQQLKNVSRLLLDNLVVEQRQKSKILANVFYGLAISISMILVFMLAYGLIFPMFGSVSGLGL